MSENRFHMVAFETLAELFPRYFFDDMKVFSKLCAREKDTEPTTMTTNRLRIKWNYIISNSVLLIWINFKKLSIFYHGKISAPFNFFDFLEIYLFFYFISFSSLFSSLSRFLCFALNFYNKMAAIQIFEFSPVRKSSSTVHR